MSDEESDAKMARLEVLKQKYLSDEDLTDDEQAELEALALDSEMPVEVDAEP